MTKVLHSTNHSFILGVIYICKTHKLKCSVNNILDDTSIYNSGLVPKNLFCC